MSESLQLPNLIGAALRPSIIAAIKRGFLYFFLRASFPHVSQGGPFLPNWSIEATCHALERVRRGETNRLIITQPPRGLKSITASVVFPAFVLGHDPTRRIICVSYSEALARKHANDCRALMRTDHYRRLFPQTRISAAKDTELETMTTAGGFRMTTSVGGTLTGRGGNLIIIDDPLKPQDAHSEAARENLKQWYSNTLLTRLDNKRKDAIIVVMQRLHVDDLAGFLLEQGDWEHLSLPAIAESEAEIPLGGGRIHIRHIGDVLHPEREPQSVLDELHHSMGSMDFSAQYQQQPIPIGGNLIIWDWFPLYDTHPGFLPTDRIIASWDTAMSASEIADFSVCVVLLVRGERVYVLDVIRGRFDFPTLRRKVIEIHHQYAQLGASYTLLIENKGSGMSLIQDLRQEHIHAVAVNAEQDKVIRMQAQTAKIEAGAVFLPRRSPWLDEFKKEILAFPKGTHDDQVDAFSQALARSAPPRSSTTVGHLIGLF